jgi:hypothetical protein
MASCSGGEPIHTRKLTNPDRQNETSLTNMKAAYTLSVGEKVVKKSMNMMRE